MSSKNWKYKPSQNLLFSLILPVIMVLYLLFLGAANGHASLTGIDGEYVYLLNGLDVSALRFENIGFTDHPGTPFLLLTGIFLQLGHLLFGHGNIIDDVIAHPDSYLRICSMFMLGLSTLVLIWGGKKILENTGSLTAMVFIQGTYFLSEIVLYMQLRFIVDRMLPLVAFILSVYTILYLYNKLSEKKYTIISGLIMGFGFIAKFNFIVLIFIPLFLINRKNWFRYGFYFIIASFLSFLPAIDKFGNAKRFMLQLFFNKGTYGRGTQGIIDTDKLISLISKLYEFGENFVWFFVLAAVAILVFLIFEKKKNDKRKRVLFLCAFLIASVLLALMSSKIFKSYYLIPTLGMSGLSTFLALQLISESFRLNKRVQTILAIAILGFLIIPTISDLNAGKKLTAKKRQARMITRDFIDTHIAPNAYWFLEPGWISGPFEANGLLWGISYVAGKNDFTSNYMRFYPKVLTYEGDDRPIKHFRTKDAEIDKIFKIDSPVYLFSSPGRRTKLLQNELRNQVAALELNVAYDTIFTNAKNDDRVIRATFDRLNDTITYTTFSTFNDMENEYPGWKQNAITKEQAFSGSKCSKIVLGDKSSSVYRMDSIPQYIENLNSVSVSCKYLKTGTRNSARLVIEIITLNEERFWYPVPCSDYFTELNNWADFSYKMYVPKKFRAVQKFNAYFHNSSREAVYIDDIKIELKGY